MLASASRMSRVFSHSPISGIILVVMIIGVATATVSATSGTGGRSGYPRSNRGFRNSQLSTARGFGKRDSGGVLGRAASALTSSQGSNYEGFLPVIFDSSRTNYPTSWLIEEMQNNPEAARFIVERLVDENGDGELTPGELTRRPNYY